MDREGEEGKAVGDSSLNPGLSCSSVDSSEAPKAAERLSPSIYRTLSDRKLIFTIPWVDGEFLETSFLPPGSRPELEWDTAQTQKLSQMELGVGMGVLMRDIRSLAYANWQG